MYLIFRLTCPTLNPLVRNSTMLYESPFFKESWVDTYFYLSFRICIWSLKIIRIIRIIRINEAESSPVLGQKWEWKNAIKNSTRVQTFKKVQIIKPAVLHHSLLSLMLLGIAVVCMNIESILAWTVITRINVKYIVFISSSKTIWKTTWTWKLLSWK